jgi:hypothetical protein
MDNKISSYIVSRLLWITGVLVLMMAVVGVTPAQAQDVGIRHTDPYWQAQYWNNTELSGEPVLVRQEPAIDYDWGLGSPHPTVNPDHFSARWTRYIDVTPGNYRFTALVDDGVRIWVDGQLIIDAWKDQAATLYTSTIYLGPGHHLVVVEYYERTGGAIARVSWQLVEPAAPTPAPSTGPWRGEYFNNTSLSGPPVLVRQEAAIDYDWGRGSPHPDVNVDHFSARWTRNVELPAGNYRFRMTVDDGGRLFVNGHTLIDAWKEQAATTYTGDIYLPGGAITVQMEYFERTGDAVARLSWSRIDAPPQPVTEWRGEYWNNPHLSGTPALVRNDSAINFDWGTGSPAPSVIGADRFSARWTRTLNLSAGWYRFSMTVDDGGRLWIGGNLVLDSWRDQGATTYETNVYHGGGAVDVRMEYYENTGLAVAKLSWSAVGAPQPTPTPAPPSKGVIIVDNLDAGFTRGGSPTGWNSAQEGYSGHLFWSRNNQKALAGYNWGRWYPNLNAGRYEVFVYIPERYTTTSQARYWVSHAGGFTLRVVNQSTNGGRWVSLGTYRFRGTAQDYVSLADVTNEPALSRLIAWDAVKWEAR